MLELPEYGKPKPYETCGFSDTKATQTIAFYQKKPIKH
jgi:hypothetical protein